MMPILSRSDVTPDDSLEAGTQVAIGIQGRAGSEIGCEKILTVTVGQEFGASMALSKSTLSNVEPGTSGTSFNPDHKSRKWSGNHGSWDIRSTSGWQASFSKSSVTLGSSQSSNNKETVGVDVFVPEGRQCRIRCRYLIHHRKRRRINSIRLQGSNSISCS